MQRLAGDIGRLVGGQINRRGGDSSGAAEPARRHPARIASRCLSLSLSVIGVAMKPGATQLAVTPRLAYSGADRLHHADHAGLGGGIIALPGIAGDADHRGDADDAAEAPAHHALHRGARSRNVAVRLTAIT